MDGVSGHFGSLILPGLPAGQYSVTAEAESHSTYRAPLTLTLSQVADLQIPLSIKAATKQVEVRDTATGVDK